VASTDTPKPTAEPVVIYQLTPSASCLLRCAQITALRGLIGSARKKADR
jgi:hypothetical protein